MKFKAGLVFFAIIIIAVAFFVFLNSGEIQLTLYPGESVHLPLSILILGSILLGVFIMFLISLTIEMKLKLKGRKIEKILNKKISALESIKKGLVNLLSGKIKNARKDLKSAYKLDEENFLPLIFLKDIENEKEIENIINKLPVELRKFYLIDYFFEHKSYENVVELGEEILQDSSFSNKDILEKLRDANLKLKNFDKAIEIQQRIGKDDKILEKIHYLKAKSSNDEKLIDDLIKKFPKLTPAYMLKYEKKGDAEILKEGFKKTKDDFFIYKLYELYENSQDEKIEKIIMKLDSSPIGKFFKALILFKKGNVNEAKKIVNYLVNDENFKIIASFLLAEISYRQEGELKESYEELRKVFNLDNLNIFDFLCEQCKNSFSKWSDFCENCGEFNALKLKWIK